MIGAGAGASLANENDQDLYLNGSCHVFATALHRRYGMSLLVVGDGDNPYWIDDADPDNSIPSVVHCYGVDADGMAWDVLGVRPLSDVSRELLDRHCDVETLSEDHFPDEAGLDVYVDGRGDTMIDRPLHSFRDDDVVEADACISRILAHMLPAHSPVCS